MVLITPNKAICATRKFLALLDVSDESEESLQKIDAKHNRILCKNCDGKMLLNFRAMVIIAYSTAWNFLTLPHLNSNDILIVTKTWIWNFFPHNRSRNYLLGLLNGVFARNSSRWRKVQVGSRSSRFTVVGIVCVMIIVNKNPPKIRWSWMKRMLERRNQRKEANNRSSCLSTECTVMSYRGA